MRRGGIVVAVALLAVGTGAALGQFLDADPYPTDGPLQVSDAVEVAYPLAFGDVTTWGMPLPESSRPATVRYVELLGVERLDVLGLLACRGWTIQPDGSFLHCAPINAKGWPPPGIATYPVGGTGLASEPRGSAGLLIGLRRQSADVEGRISAIRIVYTVDGVTYQAIEPWSLRLYAPLGAARARPHPLLGGVRTTLR